MSLILACLCAVAPAAMKNDRVGDSLESIYKSARSYDKSQFTFVPPGADARRKMRAFMASAVKNLNQDPPSSELVGQAKELGFEIVRSSDSAGKLWVIRESGEARSGGGLYILRAASNQDSSSGRAPICIQAPHIFFDTGTGEIALEVFAALKASCLFTNTVHRYSQSEEEGAADVAHSKNTMFYSATEGMLDATSWPVLQIHGFGAKTIKEKNVAAVVSDGTKSPKNESPASRLRSRLLPKFSKKVLLFGDDAASLGATTNVEGKLARERGVQFVHIELSSDRRKQWSKNDSSELVNSIRSAFDLNTH